MDGRTAERLLMAEVATRESVAPFGRLLEGPTESEIAIPYYPDRVIEGGDIGMRCRGETCFRLATIRTGLEPVSWLERHQHLSQLFIALGDAPMVMVVAEPTPGSLTDLDGTRALWFAPGSAVMLHPGAWHDFPIAPASDLTVLTISSEEVIVALTSTTSAMEIDQGDVEKIDIATRFGERIVVSAPEPARGTDRRDSVSAGVA